VSRDDPFHLRPTTEIPWDFGLVATDGYDVRGTRVWLVDLTGARPPHDLMTYTSYSGGSSISRDGRTVVVSGGDKWDQSLFVGDVLTGAVRRIDRGDVTRRPSYPVISPDGSRIAYTISADRWATQIWGGRLPDGPFVPLVIAPSGQSFGYGLAFSADGRFLSYNIGGRGRVLDLISGRVYDVGAVSDGYSIRWHPSGPILAVSSPWRQEQGWSLTLFDAERVTFSDVVRSDTGHGGIVVWKASGDAVYLWEAQDCSALTGCARGTLVERALGGGVHPISDKRLNGSLYARRDGILVTPAWVDGERMVPLVEYPSGRVLVSFCKRGGIAPECGGFS
jgi:WD40 repeat protein